MPNSGNGYRSPCTPTFPDSEEEGDDDYDASGSASSDDIATIMSALTPPINRVARGDQADVPADLHTTETGARRRDGAHLILPGSMTPPVQRVSPNLTERKAGVHLEVLAFPETSQMYNRAHMEAPAGRSSTANYLLDNPTPSGSSGSSPDSFNQAGPSAPPGLIPIFSLGARPRTPTHYEPLYSHYAVQVQPQAKSFLANMHALHQAIAQQEADLAMAALGNQIFPPIFGPTNPAFNGAPLYHPPVGWPQAIMVLQNLPLNDVGKAPVYFQPRHLGEKKIEPNFNTANWDMLAYAPHVLVCNFDMRQGDRLQLFLTLADPSMEPGDAPRTCSQWTHNKHISNPNFLTILPRAENYTSEPCTTAGIRTSVITIHKDQTQIHVQFECTSELATPESNGFFWLHIRHERSQKMRMHAVLPITAQPTLRNFAHLRFGSPGWYPNDWHDGRLTPRVPTPRQKALKTAMEFITWVGSQQQTIEEINELTAMTYNWAAAKGQLQFVPNLP